MTSEDKLKSVEGTLSTLSIAWVDAWQLHQGLKNKPEREWLKGFAEARMNMAARYAAFLAVDLGIAEPVKAS